MEKVRLNLGAGDVLIDGYVNIDRKTGQEAYPLACEDGSVDEIRASHILEHFGLHEIKDVLNNWVSKLKPGGLLKVAVPDFNKIIDEYKKGNPLTSAYMCGGQTDKNDYHKSMFEVNLLTKMFEDAGLVDILHWESEIKDCASLPVSLNLQGSKAMNEEGSELQKSLSELSERRKNIYSQYGEDGIIEAIFERIGPKNKWCLEVGAADGILFSNTRHLVEQGWNAILIESERLAYERLVENCQDYPNAIPIFGKLGVDFTLDEVLDRQMAPKDIDLVVVDVDGQDYHVINAMLDYKPRVLVAEFDPEADIEYIPEINCTKDGLHQAGKSAMVRLAASKGYKAYIGTKCNLILIHRSSFRKPEDEFVEETKTVSMKIGAIMSAPRLGFSNNLMIATKVYAPLGIDFEIGYGVFWGQTLTRMIESQLARGMDLITVLDYDSYYEKEHFLALCQLMQEYPDVDAIVPVQVKRENDNILVGIEDQAKAQAEYKANADLIEVDAGNFGLSIFRASAIKKLKKPWFLAVPNDKGEWGDGRLDEDIYFWKNWRACDLKVCLAPQVKIGHIQLMVTWPGNLEVGSKPTQQYLNDCAEDGIPEWCKVSKDYKPKVV